MPVTPYGRWDRWRRSQASRFREVRPRRQLASSPAVILVGVGQSITEPVTLTEGRWRVIVEIAKNARRTPSGSHDEHLLVLAVGDSGHFEVLVNDMAASGRWTSQVLVVSGLPALPSHSPVFALLEGAVRFEVQTSVPSAAWSISVVPL